MIHQGLLILWGAIISEVTGLDCNNVPIATIIFNDYYYDCHKMETGASVIKIWYYATTPLNDQILLFIFKSCDFEKVEKVENV